MSRYIDADLIEYEPMCRARGNGMYEDCECAYKDQIDDIPTADVRENVRATWKMIDNHGFYGIFECTNCHHYVEQPSSSGGKACFDFCPNCGADMRGGEDE